MRIALVTGSVVATVKDEELSAKKLLLVRGTDVRGKPEGTPFVAVDTVHAGKGDLVLVTEGSSARQAARLASNGGADMVSSPVDAAIVGVIDYIESDSKTTYGNS